MNTLKITTRQSEVYIVIDFVIPMLGIDCVKAVKVVKIWYTPKGEYNEEIVDLKKPLYIPTREITSIK